MTPAISPEFEQTKEKLISLLTQEYQRNQLELTKMMAIFYILGYARNKKEILKLASIFVTDFPVLQEFLNSEKAVTQEKMEDDVQKIVRKIVAENPMQAAEIAQKAMEEGMTLEKLEALYPDIKKYK